MIVDLFDDPVSPKIINHESTIANESRINNPKFNN
jgi:hypothetical protein